ncbi:MAG TPA: HlyD family efflux transporter periplasmic adaptor subunit [Paracoccus sp.]|nr:HlyD family efflux transporter periplasmic adaptor subunit [Paracoccus sp. (in: a-proteobacteria)]
MSRMRKVGIWLGGLAQAGALAWALWPEPAAVDMGMVTRGPMQVTLSAEGITRVREPYTITAPITGSITRSLVDVGDRVVRGESVVAVIQPAEPALMDARSRLQAEAAVTEAEAAVRLADANVVRAESELSHAATQLARNRELAERGTVPRRILEDMVQAHVTATQALSAARSEADVHRATLARMQAQLLGPASVMMPVDGADACCVRILAPETGTVLKVDDPSARLVQAGAPLLSIGDIEDLEIELDLLSTDAVRVPAQARALIERWGGEGVLEARVRRIEPAAFTRVSALGIEEQRVRLRLDILTPPEARTGLGDRYRVFVRLILWEGEGLLQLPQAALFRDGGGWAVFQVREGRAELTRVAVGRQAGGMAEVLSGIEEGAAVVMYPASTLSDSARVTAREG